MAITAFTGPILGFGISQTSTGQVMDYNDQRGPSLFDMGQATLDPRPQFNYDPCGAVTQKVFGLWDQQGIIDYIPFTGSTAAGGYNSIAISSLNSPTAGTALTLTGLSTLGAISTTIVAPENGNNVAVIALDSTAATLNFGQSGTVAVWNPAAGAGRALTVINTSNANSEQYIVRGRDMYGFKMTETIFASTTSTGTGVGKKAFKYVQSVTPSTATTISATGVSVGFSDIYGYPLKAAYLAGISVWVSSAPNTANSIALSTANSVTASTIATQTSTTPDVRGTYTSSIASNGSSANTSSGVRVTMYQPLTPVMLYNTTNADQSAVFGVTQYSDF